MPYEHLMPVPQPKLTTYDPHHPEWANGTPAQDSERDRNLFGFYIQSGNVGSTKKLIVLEGTDDAQEHSGAKVMRYIIDELLSGSTLASTLLNSFTFLFFPFISQQGVRDGMSRFPHDWIYNTLDNGETEIGPRVKQIAIANWIKSHPSYDPLKADSEQNLEFCNLSLHCDNSAFNYGGSPTNGPNTPHLSVSFKDPHTGQYWAGDFGRTKFMEGFRKQGWKETVVDGAIVGTSSGTTYGGTKFIWEVPWRHNWHKASFWHRQDLYQNLAIGFLEGLSVAADAASYFEGPSTVSGVGVIEVAGVPIYEGPAGVSGQGAIQVQGAKHARGGAEVSNLGFIETLGQKVGRGPVVVSGGPFDTQGQKIVSGPAEVSSVGSITVQGTTTEFHEGPVEVASVGAIEVTGEVILTAPLDGPVTVSGVGQIQVSGYKVATGTAEVRGTGLIQVIGPKPTVIPFPHIRLSVGGPAVRVKLSRPQLKLSLRVEEDE